MAANKNTGKSRYVAKRATTKRSSTEGSDSSSSPINNSSDTVRNKPLESLGAVRRRNISQKQPGKPLGVDEGIGSFHRGTRFAQNEATAFKNPQYANSKVEEPAKKKRTLLSRLLLFLGILLLAIAVAIGSFIVWQYLDAQNRYANIQSVAGLSISQPELVDGSLQLEDLVFDWAALRALNSDVVGWIIVPNTNINYPIVQGRDNEHYLYYLFDTSSSGTGSIFADYENSPTLDGQHNIIYGHNMLDGSMFSDIHLYTNQAYFDEHRTLFLCTPTRNFELSAAAVISVPQDAPLRKFAFDNQDAFASFVQETLASPRIAAPNLADMMAESESLYSLVTCETFDNSRRVILNAFPVRSVVPANAQ